MTTNRIYCLTAALALSLSFMTAAAQTDPVGDFAAKISQSTLTFDYTYTVNNLKVKVTGGGKTLIQDNKYYVEGDGLRVWCDGSSVWIVDTDAAEVVIEPAESVEGMTANPVLIVLNLDSLYTWDKNGRTVKFDGKQCLEYTLQPTGKSDLRDVKLYMVADRLVGAEFRMGEMHLAFSISNVEFTATDPNLSFAPAEFPQGSIITDLR